MTRATFFKHFDLLADQPDAVAKMRELVLDLAIRGKVCEQLAKDKPFVLPEPPNDEGKRLQPPTSSEEPFPIPASWRWVRFGQVFDIQGGTQPPKSTFVNAPAKGYVRLLQIRDFGPRPVPTYIPMSDKLRVCKPVDVMLARYGASVGKIFMGQDGVFNVALTKIEFDHSAIFNRFVYWWFQTSLFQAFMTDMSRSAQAGFNKGDLFPIAIPMPPLAEQRRIVAKVDELMALCDELEQRQQARQHASGLLQQSALHHLLAAREPQTFAAAWHRVRDHFHLLHDTPDALPQLRQAILQLAVQGRLVPQNPKDEPAEELLQSARKLMRELDVRTFAGDKSQISSQDASTFAHVLHPGWALAKISDFALVKGGKRLPAGAAFSPAPTPHIYIQVTNMKGGTIISEKLKYIDASTQKQIRQYTINKEDLYITIAGTIGDVGEVPGDFDGMNLTENAAKVIFRGMDKQFLKLALTSGVVQEQFIEKAKQMAQPKLALKRILESVVPIPPLAEQKRIVARVEELLRWCDTLEAQLHQTRTLGAHLLASTLHHLLAA